MHINMLREKKNLSFEFLHMQIKINLTFFLIHSYKQFFARFLHIDALNWNFILN